MKRKLYRKRRKGFTLVELVIVLVILAILIAIGIPTFMNYIMKAKEKSTLLYARTFYLSVQSVAAEEYGAGNAYSQGSEYLVTYEAITNLKPPPGNLPEHKRIKEIYNLMEAGSISQKFEAIALVERGDVTIMRYKDVTLNMVFEWRRENPRWKKLENITNDTPWAGDILPSGSLGAGIFWNGYQP